MKRIISIILALSAVALMSACTKSEDKAEIKIPILNAEDQKVNTYTAKVGDFVVSSRYNGKIDYPYGQNISFTSVSGTLFNINFIENQEVKKGDVLATLKSDDLDYEIKQQQLLVNSKVQLDEETKAPTDKYSVEFARIAYEEELTKLKTLEDKKDSYTIYAPFNGMISYSSKSKQGEPISQGQVIGYIQNTEMPYIVYSGEEEALASYSYGLEVTLKQEKLTATSHVIKTTQSNGWNGKSNYQLIVAIPKGFDYNPSLPVEINIASVRKENVLTVPDTAITTFNGGDYVNLLIGDERLQVSVEIGLEAFGKCEIISGIENGDVVILAE